jgi:hypothetical protein
MPKISYIEKQFKVDSLALIERCNAVIVDYQRQGFSLTLRQLYYQMVSRNIIENTERSYKRLGDLVSNARLAGLIDWNAIEDRGRNLRQNGHWSTPAEIIRSARRSYRVDKWEGQRYRPEVWIEKQALEGVIAGVCSRLDVPYFACKGYNSQSEQWGAGHRLRGYMQAGYEPIIFHLGDHDPSGIDMTRDNRDRLEMFMGGVELRRLALNMSQIDEYQPPPNPAKESDSRFASYIELYGDESWELDALEPQVLVGLIESAVLGIRDNEPYERMVALENEGIRLLQTVESHWDAVVEYLG